MSPLKRRNGMALMVAALAIATPSLAQVNVCPGDTDGNSGDTVEVPILIDTSVTIPVRNNARIVTCSDLIHDDAVVVSSLDSSGDVVISFLGDCYTAPSGTLT